MQHRCLVPTYLSPPLIHINIDRFRLKRQACKVLHLQTKIIIPPNQQVESETQNSKHHLPLNPCFFSLKLKYTEQKLTATFLVWVAEKRTVCRSCMTENFQQEHFFRNFIVWIELKRSINNISIAHTILEPQSG